MREDFTDVRFGNYDFSTLDLVVVSSSSYYDQNLLPNPNDTTLEISGGDGQYYFGQTYKNREFKINVAFDNVKEQTWRKISYIFSTDKLQDLVFNQNPYKTYRAKLKSKPEFKYICFRDKDTQERIYKGTGTLNFIAYHPYAFCFNKYVVRAADFYKCTMPADIIDSTSKNHKFAAPAQLPGLIKDHYNVKPNMAKPWKGGYPSIEQVQWGELYFKLNNHENGYTMDCGEEKSKYTDLSLVTDEEFEQMKATNDLANIIDVRHYWDNIPQWESTAKLLVTPTLDYDHNLIYMPQYSTTNYYNMETGLNRQNGLIGCRLLVYNPGDIDIPFELRLSDLDGNFSHFRGSTEIERFRISRYNVQRLSIEQAVDWTGLRVQNRDEEKEYKYGTRYVSILEPSAGATSEEPLAPTIKHLKTAHPEYIYIAEPIPKDKLGHFIRLFYWQSNNLGVDFMDWEEAKEIANRYEELLAACITEDESNELYWNTLFTCILSKYKELNDSYDSSKKFFSDNYTYEDFCYDFIYNPPEYFRELHKFDEEGNEVEMNYGEFQFNLAHLPQYYTYDFLEITNENFNNIISDNYSNAPAQSNLILDFDSRMLYNIKENKNFEVDYGMNKTYYTDNVVKGKWFLLPPGWSLLDISPVVNENIWGGKRWLDARPFKWGTTNNNKRAKFDKYETLAIIDYLAQASPLCNLQRRDITDKPYNPNTEFWAYGNTMPTSQQVKDVLTSGTWNLDQLEDLIQFRRWYEGTPEYENYKDWLKHDTNYESTDNFGYELWRNRIEQVEYGFLKMLADYWRINHLDANGLPDTNHDISEWWWYANNYTWNNFPPLYWAYVDFLNQMEIKYIPQYY